MVGNCLYLLNVPPGTHRTLNVTLDATLDATLGTPLMHRPEAQRTLDVPSTQPLDANPLPLDAPTA